MSRRLKYVFPAGTTQDICLTQTLAGAANLTFNGNLVDKVLNQVSFISKGYSRSISFSSANDLSPVNFTITGTQNGVPLTEVRAGPTAGNTVYSVQVYDVITSIAANVAANAVSVGSGLLGYFPLIEINLDTRSNVINYTLALAKLTAAQVNTAVFGTVDNIANNGRTYLDNIANNFNVFQIRALAVTDNYIYSNAGNPTYSYLIVAVTQTAVADTIQMNFTQI
jgi:hypothetical protein